MNNQMIMDGRSVFRNSSPGRLAGAVEAADSSSLNLLLLALISDIQGVQT
jgi:hypothetical protein